MGASGPPSTAGPGLTYQRPSVFRNPGLILEREGSLGTILMLPGFLLLFAFMAYPFLLGIWLALSNERVGIPGVFVGFRNFIDLANDSIYRQTVLNTTVYAVVTVPFKLALGLGLALVLNNKIPYRNAVRAAVLLPWIVPTALSSLGWFMIYDPVFSPVNWVLKSMGLITKNINFLGDANLAIFSVCLANIWRGTPFFAVSILAGLQAVPQELHEAAAIDGAGVWQRFRTVTVPVISPIVLITTLLSIIWTFSDFQLIFVLTKGGPANMTHIFGTYAYQIGMSATQIGMGAAIALSMFPILAILAIWLLRYIRREV